jgi:hypothetical protein
LLVSVDALLVVRRLVVALRGLVTGMAAGLRKAGKTRSF